MYPPQPPPSGPYPMGFPVTPQYGQQGTYPPQQQQQPGNYVPTAYGGYPGAVPAYGGYPGAAPPVATSVYNPQQQQYAIPSSSTQPQYGSYQQQQQQNHTGYEKPHQHQHQQQHAVPTQVVVDDAYAKSDENGGVSQYVANAEKSVRLGFIRKVYGILSVQLLITFGLVALFTFVPTIKNAVLSHPAMLWVAIIASTGFLIALSCCPGVATKYPGNYICLFGFTLCEGYLVGTISAMYGEAAVIKAVLCCSILVFALTLFAFQTKIDFTAWAGALFVCLIGLMLLGFMAAIFRDKMLDNVYAAAGAMIFSLYIIVDTQQIIGGTHHAHKFTVDQYVLAALNLYIDVVQLFLYLLRLFGNNRN